VEGGRCVGVSALDGAGAAYEVRGRNTLLATGGVGQLFSVTTNPAQATGDGLAMALRAGAAVADVEFMQFHPTALHHPAMPRPLLSEALRGHGAKIRDGRGRQFVDELLPRDEVSRAITAKVLEEGGEHVWLDATGLEDFAIRFPTIAASLAAAGLDPATDLLPIAPAAHFLSGGVLTDLDGATSLPGLWACGEAACTGVHGANRLASNSLLEGMVFAPRVVEAVVAGRGSADPTGAMRSYLGDPEQRSDVVGGTIAGPPPSLPSSPEAEGDFCKLREALQRAMTAGAGVLRTAVSLAATEHEVARVGAALGRPRASRQAEEVRNLVVVGRALLAAAAAREESRGNHTRSDFPDRDPLQRRRLVFAGARQSGEPGTGAT
jgi:L-aspartate oxidase